MKKRLACLLAGICTLASAELVVKNLPPSLERPLQGNGLLAAEMDAQGVLHLRSKKATISELDYNNFVMHGLCSEQWRDPARFASWNLGKVELLAVDGQQGYAFDASGDVCEQLGRCGQPGQNFRKRVAERPPGCQQGQCGK